MNKFDKYFPYFITVTLIALAGIFKSAATGYASVVSLGLILAKDLIEKIAVAKAAPVVAVPEEVKKALFDLNARISTIEFGIRQRGF